MQGRNYRSGIGYRYGFNGKEVDNEVKGENNEQDYGMRIYDPRLGRFLSVDPLTKSYPMLTSYQFASNSPIAGIDLDGGEILPVNSSIYLQRYSGINFLGKVYNNYDVEIVYNNIPKILKDPSKKDLIFTHGGPVTAYGRDYDPKIDGTIIYQKGRYYNMGSDFVGDEEDLDVTKHSETPSPSSSNSTQGLYSLHPDEPNNSSTEANAAASDQVASGASAIQETAGIGSNQLKTSEWNASYQEQTNRTAFYQATNLVDENIKKNLIGDKNLLTGSGRADLINFIADGTLPTRGAKIESLNLQQLEGDLRVAFTGVQLLYKGKIEYRRTLDTTIDNLVKTYKNSGGKIPFEKIYNFKCYCDERPK